MKNLLIALNIMVLLTNTSCHYNTKKPHDEFTITYDNDIYDNTSCSADSYIYNFIDQKGNFVSKYIFCGDEDVKEFAEGYAAVTCYMLRYEHKILTRKDKKHSNFLATDLACGYINEKGEFAIGPFNDWVDIKNFSEGLAVIGVSSKAKPSSVLYGYINKHGKFVIPPVFTDADCFNNDKAVVTFKGTVYYINKQGKLFDFNNRTSININLKATMNEYILLKKQ
jgi:hypothetical protein